MKPLVRRWTADEIEKLRTLMEKGVSAARCAAALKRSEQSVKKAARLLGGDLAGVRAIRARSRQAIAAAERDLPPGARRNNGTFV